MKWCPRCEAEKPVEEFPPNRARYDGRGGYCRECHLAACREYERQHRRVAVELLGGLCAECGIADYRVLVIDHRNGGGGEERKNGLKQIQFYKQVLVDPEPYQVLCHNCNWLKRLEVDGRPTETVSLV